MTMTDGVLDPVVELRGLAQQVRDYQREQGWSDARTADQISQIGSTKTYKRILDPKDDLEELTIENQVKAYRGAVSFIEVLRAKDKIAEPEYDDFTNVTTGLAAVQRAFVEDNNSRFVAIQGESGTGKDAIKNALLSRDKWSKVTIAIETDEHCRHNIAPQQVMIMRQLNAVRGAQIEPHHLASVVKDRIVNAIGSTRLVLVINEMHHVGPRGLNEVKNLINACPRLVIVGMFIPALLRRLMLSAYDEAAQLFGNRLAEVVRLPSPPASEALLMMERRGVVINDPSLQEQVGAAMQTMAPTAGNWKFVVKFTRQALSQMQRNRAKELTTAMYGEALKRTKELCFKTGGR
jgi:hypothetical protein